MADLTSGRDPASGPAFARRDGGRARADGGRLTMDYTPAPRQDAFKAADRHTARVKFLRRAIIIGAVLAMSILSIVICFNPFRNLPGAMTLAGVGIHGTTITMDSPKISGAQQGGGTYEVTAKSGIQDITAPTIVNLIGVDATVGMADHTRTHILANTGIYDNKVDTMALSGNVHIANTSGYVLNMKSALMRFRDGIFSSHERLTVDLKGGTISADDMLISNNGHSIVFRGNIASSFEAPADDPEPTPIAAPDPAAAGGAILSAAPAGEAQP